MGGVSPEIASAVLYVVMCVAVGAGLLGLAKFLTKIQGTAKQKQGKYEAYECGVPLLGSARDRFGVKFYLVALLFILFDVETVFLIPYAVSYKELGTSGFLGVTAFVGILGVGLLYLSKRGALDWD